MTVRKAWTDEGEYDFSGQGYRRGGNIRCGEDIVTKMSSKPLCEMLRCGVLCNNGDIATQDSIASDTSDIGEWSAAGDPTETALLIAAAKGGMSHSAERTAFRRLDEIPFDSDTRRMTVTVRTPSGDTSSYTKGAADIILSRCTEILTSGGVKSLGYSTRKRIEDACAEMSSAALRVLAFAYKPKGDNSPDSGMVFLGLMGMSDPPREEAKKPSDSAVKQVSGR